MQKLVNEGLKLTPDKTKFWKAISEPTMKERLIWD